MARERRRDGQTAIAGAIVRFVRAVVGTVSAVLLLAGGLVVASLAGLAALALSGQRLSLPAAAVDWVEARLEQAVGDAATLRLGGLDLWVGEDRVPRVALRGLAVSGAGGGGRAELPELEVGLMRAALARGEIRPETLRLPGARATLRREADGSLGLAFGAAGSGSLVASGSVAEILDAVDRMLAAGPLSGIDRIEADGLSLVFDDLMTGRAWRLVDGRLVLSQTRRETTMELSFALSAPDGGPPARAQLWFRTAKGSPEAVLFAEVSRIDAAELAAELPALAALGLVDAPVSAAFRGAVDAEGALAAVWTRLMIGPGVFVPRRGLDAVPFQRAVVDFEYVPGQGRIELTEIAVDSRMLRLRASGWADPEGAGEGVPQAVVAQLRLSELAVDPEGMFAAPLAFAGGAVDLRVAFSPFSATLGQISAFGSTGATADEPAPALRGSARVAAAEAGWEVALDAEIDAIEHDRLVALWPLGLAPGTRSWLSRNVLTGTLQDVRAAVRLRPGQAPVIAVGYDFGDAEVRVMPSLPPVTGGAGYAVLHDNAYTMVLDRGRIDPGAGGTVDVAGSVFRVPDVAARPSLAEVDLHARGSLEAAQSLLHQQPFGLRGPDGAALDVGSGSVAVTARVVLPLIAALRGPDVTYTVRGEIAGFRSTTLVPGQVLAADWLDLEATSGGELAVWGSARLGEVPLEGRWVRPMAAGGGEGAVEGTVELSPRFARAFGLPVTEGAVEGSARAAFRVSLPADAPPRLRLTSDLGGLSLRLPELGWSKPAAARGRLEVEGTLGRPVALSRLAAEMPGLSAEGTVRLAADGTLAQARFARLRVGGWLDGTVELAGRGRGNAPALTLRGGTVDLRGMPAAAPAPGGRPAGRSPTPVEVALDRLVVTDSIGLTDFRAELASGGGLSGSFRGRLNGRTPVEGRVTPQGGGSALRITADDAGAVLRAAGLFGRAHGGALELVLAPRSDGPGQEGRLRVSGGLRVQDAPVLAELLNAMSVVGLLEQLSGPGIAFSEVEADLRLTPAGIEIRNGTAVGPSMGVSLAGVYAAANGRVEFEGVVSPFYVLNAAAGLFSRRGEGLFGFTYRVSGSADEPRVDVNPLSVLTPGMFRDIFRTAPPRLSE